MNTYSSYKDSGIEWMGNIPESWELTKNRFGFLKHKNGLNESDDTNVLSLTTTGVKVKRDLNFGKSSESYIGHQLVEQGDIVFTPRDFDQTPILSDVSKYEGCISNLYIVDKTKENVLNRYVNYYWYGLKYSVDYFKNFSHGMRYSFNRFQFDEIPLLIPSLREQQQISDYLDYKTSKIDILIEKTQQKIELLKEQRTSLINTTVTKGLDPNVEMKDSGVEWIGDVPVGWDLVRLKYLFSLEGGKDPKRIQDDDGEYPILGTGGEISRGSDFLYNKPTLLLGRKGTIDKPFLFDKPFWVSDVMYYTIQKSDITPKYLYLLFTLTPFDYYRYGSTQPSMSRLDYESMFFPIPKKEERQQIVDYLDKETSKIDKLVDIESKRIILLKEYRQSLISEVVTGKVDVRNEVLV
ncbi:hypothetical protein HOE22_00950 [Candidatus Woesearchaeota archaeon]|nr:hypothetical protein [Candidatus Woesearchaeota archaeon]